MINEPWSPEKTALLKEIWPLNLTGRQMEEVMASNKMPVPKNAIYKKAYRLGLPRRKLPNDTYSELKKPQITKTSRSTALQITSSSPEKFELSYRASLTQNAEKYDLRAGCCWPLGDPKHTDFRFCGEARVSRNYCATHEKRAYFRP